MAFSALSQQLLFLILIILHTSDAATDTDSQGYVYHLCPSMETVSLTSDYQININTTLSQFTSNSRSHTRFYNTTVGSGDSRVYGLFFCRLDVTDDICQNCVSLAINELTTHCTGKKQSIVWYFDECVTRYSDEPFLGTMRDSPMIPMWNRQNSLDIFSATRNMTGFMNVLINTMNHAADNATGGSPERKFATEEDTFSDNLTSSNTIYTLAECTADISLIDCKRCLNVTIGNITELCNMRAGCTLMCPNCNIRYDTIPFYGDAVNNSARRNPGPGFTGYNSRKQAVLIGAITGAALAVTLVFAVIFFVYKRKSKKAHKHVDDSSDMEAVESLKYKFRSIRSATSNFSADKKLGEGGFGAVFKGTLKSGQDIAVKRLSVNSKQGNTEFKTEVLLVARLQHRNLVKLLGFCISRKEKLLVYEYLENLSLDRFLHDPTKCATLDWDTRFKIICGIARGLLYLHEDSRLKIIHRDLKSSNVLLDMDMNPKISDFGMARLFGADETQGNTNKIAGTFGYMAPEYVVAGQYSVKSDVYSFGIIVLEIISGQRNKFAKEEDEESLVHRAWRLWNEDITMELVDKAIGNAFLSEEAEKCIHIGLLCIQEDAGRRPRMAAVVAALSGDAIVLPTPTPPHFFSASAAFGLEESTGDQSGSTFSGTRDITVVEPR